MNKRKVRFFSFLAVFVLVCSIITGCLSVNTVVDKTESSSEKVNKSIVDLDEKNIQQENIMTIIKELISEDYKGRLAGTKGNQLATQYIADYFKQIGLESPQGLENYMQNYKQAVVELKDKPILQIVDEDGQVLTDLNYSEEFVLRRLSGESNNIDIEAPIYLIKSTDDLLKENDGRFEGKIILIPFEYNYLLGNHHAPADYAKSTGALCAISEFDLEKNTLGYVDLKVTPLSGRWLESDAYRPHVFVNSNTFSNFVEAAKEGNKLHFSCSSEVNISGDAANVVGLIPGSDPELKDNYVIIGAHFDHVGDNMNGTYNPGVLDNASGVAVLMELARVIKESYIELKQPLLFIAFNGESEGFIGSDYYCNNPIYPLDKAVMINLDMVGSSRKLPLTVATVRKDSKVSLRDTLIEYAKELSIETSVNELGGSDHVSFDYKGVPSVLLIHNDMESGYHTPKETIESVDGDRIEEVTKLVLYYIKDQS